MLEIIRGRDNPLYGNNRLFERLDVKASQPGYNSTLKRAGVRMNRRGRVLFWI